MYLWMVIVGGFFCAGMAWGIGANDVANFFGPPVGAKSITLKNAMIIAFIFEFIGAFFMGSNVTNTIRKKIVDFDAYNGEADILLLGMFSALTAASLWVYLATKYSLPVSTTQSIIGAIIGFVIVSKGPDAVAWETVINIVIFWIGTPILGCIACLLIYAPLRHFVLSKEESYDIAKVIYPLFVFLVLDIMSTFLLFKGFKRIDELGDWSEENPWFVVLIGIGIGVFFAVVAYFALVRTNIVTRYAEKDDKKVNKNDIEMDTTQKVTSSSNVMDNTEAGDIESTKSSTSSKEAAYPDLEKDSDKEKDVTPEIKKKSEATAADDKLKNVGSKLAYGLEVDVFDDLTKAESDLQKYSVKFDAKTERLFEWLSVLAATFGIFAHGSNDVANAIAPFASIISLSQQSASDAIDAKNNVDWYVLLIGSIFMSIGCITYGYNVIKTLGVKLAKMSPSRGYSTQVAAALVIIFASNYGFPASTTHCQVGATIGVGLIEKIYSKDLKWSQVFNWWLLFKVFFGWIGTIVIAGSTSALIFSVMAYSPCA